MVNVKFNLKQLLRELSAKNNKDYEYQQVAQAAGLSRFTVASIASDSSVRIEKLTIAKLIEFFKDEGMPITLLDLIVVTDD